MTPEQERLDERTLGATVLGGGWTGSTRAVRAFVAFTLSDLDAPPAILRFYDPGGLRRWCVRRWTYFNGAPIFVDVGDSIRTVARTLTATEQPSVRAVMAQHFWVVVSPHAPPYVALAVPPGTWAVPIRRLEDDTAAALVALGLGMAELA